MAIDVNPDLLWLLAGVFIRGVGMLAILPLGEGVGLQRIPLAVALAGTTFFDASLFPRNLEPIGIGGFISEFLIGLLLGLPVALCVECVTMAGELIDTGRGQNLGSMYDPIGGVESGVLGILGRWYIWSMLLVSGAATALVGAFLRSLKEIPVGSFGGGSLVELGHQVTVFVTGSLGGMLEMVLPLFVIFLVVDLALGYLAKAIPNLSLNQESFLIKSYVGGFFMMLTFEWSIGEKMLHLAAYSLIP